MPAETSRAVFLSYASQDAEAARRICEALRSGGVEVWFDADGGLEHGDEWDQKIRRQVKECVLFIPVISANTQAREEGYFRIEWELAAQRAMGIASGVPFILPVVIDDTREPDALVPDRFRTVQWTRLRGGEVPADVQLRFLKLWSHRTGVLKNEAARATESAAFHASPSPAEAIAKPGAKTYALIAAAVAIIVGGAGWWMLHRSSPSAAPVASAPASTAKSTPATIEADQLTARAEASINKLNYTRETLAAADDLARRAIELANDSAHAWAVRALVHASYLQRSWDFSEKRRQDTQEFARRALALDPNETTAMLATCYVLRQQRAFAQAEAMARQAVALRPNDYRLRASLIAIVSNQNRWEEAFTLAAESARMFPREPLVHYGLASGYTQLGRFDEALASYEAALAIQSFAGAVLYKTILLAGWKGDLVAARATLDQLTPEERVEDRAVGVAMWLGLMEHNPARVQAAAALTARNYFEDAVTPGAKAWFTALALQLDDKAALARQQWSAAEATLRERRRDHPDVVADQARLAITLVWLDRADEAAREIAPFEAAAREQPNRDAAALLAQYYASLGDAAKAVPYLRQTVNKLPLFYERSLPLDPWWDKIRRSPEFAALLAETKKETVVTPTPDAKSVAVLAFANLSEDKANEYFSDGISEELINVLGSVPGLRVAGSTSAFSFKGKSLPIPEIARQLGVAYVVEGTVRKDGTALRINAKLIDAASGFQVWASGNLDREHKDILALQTEIAGLIATNLSLKLGDTPRATKTVNPEAHRLVLEGRHYWNQRSAAALDRAETAFQQAIALAPGFAEAHAGLADVYQVRMTNFTSSGDDAPALAELKKAQQAAERARELDPSLAEPYATLGYVTLYSGSFQDAAALLQRAIALNPNLAEAHRYSAPVLSAQGRLDLGVDASRRAMEIDPLSVVNCTVYSRFLGLARRPAEALKVSARAIRLQVDDLAITHFARPVALWALARQEEAIEEARLVLRSDARGAGDAEALWVLHEAGLGNEVTRMRENLESKLAPENYLRGFNLVAVGRAEDAWPFLQHTPRGNMLNLLFYSRVFDAVRDDPRFQPLLVKLGCAEEYKVGRETLARMTKQAMPSP